MKTYDLIIIGGGLQDLRQQSQQKITELITF